MNDTKFIVLSSVFFLLFIFGMGSLVLEKPVSQFIKASSANVDGSKSYIFVKPKPLSGVEPEKVTVEVYIRTTDGTLLSKKNVRLTTDPPVNVSPSDTQVTDDGGKAVFTLSSATPVTTALSAVETSSNTKLTQTLSVEFKTQK